MVRKLAAAAALALGALAATGCATGDLQRMCDTLTLENEDLMRQKAQAEGDLLACRAKCDSLTRQLETRPGQTPGVAPIPFQPPDLEGVDIRRIGNQTVINMPSDVFFSSGSSTLNRQGQRTMARIADYIQTNHPAGTLRVEGHADTDPIRRTRGKYHCNWELSFKRAHSVMHFLITKGGIAPKRVVCESYGEHHPRDPRNKSKNRRVEIVLAR